MDTGSVLFEVGIGFLLSSILIHVFDYLFPNENASPKLLSSLSVLINSIAIFVLKQGG